MSKIIEKLHVMDKAMKVEAIRDTLGLTLQQIAIQAMMEGIGIGGAWEQYMSLFADNVEQLKVLTTPTQDEPSWVREARAYMIANAICGADTTTQTSLRVAQEVDNNLNSVSDGKIVDPGQGVPPGGRVRPFKVPLV